MKANNFSRLVATTAASFKNLKYASACLGLITGSLLAFPSSAGAFTFKTNYDAALNGADAAKGDILLKSVEFDGKTIADFGLVKQADIVSNDIWTKGNTGAASADRGDKATVGLSMENVDNAGVVKALGNKNLNSIIDTEDSGNFAINLFFDKAVDNLFFWERGKNSKLDVQALDANGNLIGNLFHLGSSANWENAGYSLDTMEIGDAQTVGSLGVSLKDLGVSDSISGIRMTSLKEYNGPDWKVVGSAATASVPEPATLAGLGLVGGLLVTSRRRKASRVS